MRKLIYALGAVALMSLTLVSCDKENKKVKTDVTILTVEPSSLTINIGESKKVGTAPTDDAIININPIDAKYTVASEDAAVAAVENNNTIKGVAAGKTKVTIKAGSKTATIEVEVIDPNQFGDFAANMFFNKIIFIPNDIPNLDKELPLLKHAMESVDVWMEMPSTAPVLGMKDEANPFFLTYEWTDEQASKPGFEDKVGCKINGNLVWFLLQANYLVDINGFSSLFGASDRFVFAVGKGAFELGDAMQQDKAFLDAVFAFTGFTNNAQYIGKAKNSQGQEDPNYDIFAALNSESNKALQFDVVKITPEKGDPFSIVFAQVMKFTPQGQMLAPKAIQLPEGFKLPVSLARKLGTMQINK